MLERYTHFLKQRSVVGDVIAEARGKKEDHLLKGEYIRFYQAGTAFRTAGFVQSVLTSKQIKLKPKGVVGLEFADLLAVATKLDVLIATRSIPNNIESQFMKELTPAIQQKYFRVNGKVLGYGKKLLK